MEDRGGYVMYGDCDVTLGPTEGSCTTPLAIENVTCPGEPTAVAIWGWDGKQMRRAKRALRVVDTDRAGPRPRVSLSVNAFGHCFPPMTTAR